jgi:hypothetical protein
MRDLRRGVRRRQLGEDMGTVDRDMMPKDARVKGRIWRVGIGELSRVRFWMICWEDDLRCPSYSSFSILVFILGKVASLQVSLGCGNRGYSLGGR